MLLRRRNTRPYVKPRRYRTLALEQLECRAVLSGGPTVTGVEVASTAWDTDFYAYLQSASLGTDGYAIPVGSSVQAKTLSWTNLDQIKIAFSEDVHVDVSDLSLSGVNTAVYHFSSFHYDPQTCVATWTLGTPLTKDRLRLDLDATGNDPVRDLAGNVLDGEWVNNTDTYASGNGTDGGDFEFTFNVLPADVNNSASVTYYDYLYVRQLEGKSTTSTGYLAARDLDGSGLIDSADWQAALNRVSDLLPSGSPAGTGNDAPTTSGFDLVKIDNHAIDVAVSLLAGFDDAEDSSSGLTYSILSNSNASLFDTCSLNSSTGELVLSTVEEASGRSTITVRATDSGGLSVDGQIVVDVDYVNQPPLIINLTFSLVTAGTWLVSGDVTDPDDDVTNYLVEFYGVFETRTDLDEDGHFEFAVVLDPEEWGEEFCVTYDPHGLESNIPSGLIGLT